MAEFSGAKGIFINGREQNGRTHQRADGTYESLDLKDVSEGEVVTVVTREGAQELIKIGGSEHDSALANWKMGPAAVRIALSELAGNGAEFIHYGVVLRERLGLQVSYPDSEQPHVVRSLGAIASIVSVRPAEKSESQEGYAVTA